MSCVVVNHSTSHPYQGSQSRNARQRAKEEAEIIVKHSPPVSPYPSRRVLADLAAKQKHVPNPHSFGEVFNVEKTYIDAGYLVAYHLVPDSRSNDGMANFQLVTLKRFLSPVFPP